MNSKGEVVDPAYRRTSPDHIFVQGVTEQGVISSLVFRNSKGTTDDTGIRWIISGTKGEVSITGSEMWQLLDKELKLRVKIGGEPAQNVSFDDHRVAAAEKVKPMAANVTSVYHAFAKGDKTKYATFESAAKTSRLLERIRQASAHV